MDHLKGENGVFLLKNTTQVGQLENDILKKKKKNFPIYNRKIKIMT